METSCKKNVAHSYPSYSENKNACRKTTIQKCGFKVGVLGNKPYAEVACEIERKTEC